MGLTISAPQIRNNLILTTPGSWSRGAIILEEKMEEQRGYGIFARRTAGKTHSPNHMPRGELRCFPCSRGCMWVAISSSLQPQKADVSLLQVKCSGSWFSVKSKHLNLVSLSSSWSYRIPWKSCRCTWTACWRTACCSADPRSPRTSGPTRGSWSWPWAWLTHSSSFTRSFCP